MLAIIGLFDNVYKTFIARYGGDEFIIVAKTDSEELIKKLCADIKATLIRLNDEADEALYKDKKAAG